MNYQDFLVSKMPQAERLGFEPSSPAHSALFPHQANIARWAVRGGRRAVFASFGLGKTRTHLQVAKWICERETAKKYLIVAPLGVRQEFTKVEGPAMGLEITYCKNDVEVDAAKTQIVITNYERVRDGDITIDAKRFNGAGLDEASVLRSFGSKTYQTFLSLFKSLRYRFVFTATPSPNKHKELIHYGGFLGVMDTGEALTRFFQRDSTQANNLTLYPHMEEKFWLWLSSWAVFMQRPSDLGYSDAGYDLPPLNVHWKEVAVDHTKAWGQVDSWGQSQLFLDQSSGLKEVAAVKRETILTRVQECVKILSENDEVIRQKAIHAGLVSSQQGEGQSEQSPVVSSKQGAKHCKGAEMGREKSETVEGASGWISCQKRREIAPKVKGLVSEKQETGGPASKEAEAGDVWIDTGNSRRATEKAAREMRDLRKCGNAPKTAVESAHRSLPQDRQGEGLALRPLQLCAGDDERRAIVAQACGGISRQFIVWCELNEEQRALEKALKTLGISYTSIDGSQPIDDREEMFQEWKCGQTCVLLSKPVLLGSGTNLQHNSWIEIFLGSSYKFNDVVRAIHRVFRFMQRHPVHIYFIFTESERPVIETLKKKWAQHNELVEKMSALLR